MPSFQDLSNMRFGRLTVLSQAENKGVRTAWICLCDCGATVVTSSNLIKSGKTSSCGCIRKEIAGARFRTHSTGYESREYRSWNAAKKRCRTRSNKAFKNYGAVGVDMCAEWAGSFEKFLSDMGRCPDGMTLDRINPFGNYEPGNCRWADRATQNKNKRKHYKGESL